MNRRDFLQLSLPIATGPLWLPRYSLAQGFASSPPPPPLPPAGADGWISLINDRDLTGWYSMLSKSGKDAAQTKGMVRIEQEMLHILGNELTSEPAETGYVATNQEFENVHIRVEYKWGVKRFPPQNDAKRDNGILYGLVGPDKVWPTCVECQIEETDVGDFFLVDGVRGVQAEHDDGLFGSGGPVLEPTTGRKVKDGDFEKLDDWNVVEVIWKGDRATHLVNGRIVNVISRLQQPDPANPGKFLPLTRGKIAIEIEFAEIWFRRIEVKSLA